MNVCRVQYVPLQPASSMTAGSPFMRNSFVFFFLFLSGLASAQQNITVVYNELYQVISFEKQKKTNDFNRQEYLYVNGDSVGLFSFGLQKPDKKTKTVGAEKDHHALFLFPKLGRSLSENYWTKPFDLKEYKLPTFDWKFHEDTIRIVGYLCNVAVADGVVAWYAKDIAIPLGPLHYYGLPGLILMLEDHNTKRLYKAASVKLEGPSIVLPELELKACRDGESKLTTIKSYFGR
jgi:GLPGLI family protein